MASAQRITCLVLSWKLAPVIAIDDVPDRSELVVVDPEGGGSVTVYDMPNDVLRRLNPGDRVEFDDFGDAWQMISPVPARIVFSAQAQP